MEAILSISLELDLLLFKLAIRTNQGNGFESNDVPKDDTHI